MKTYRFHFLDKTTYQGDGENVADAFTALGFGAGAVKALDYYEVVTTINFVDPSEVFG